MDPSGSGSESGYARPGPMLQFSVVHDPYCGVVSFRSGHFFTYQLYAAGHLPRCHWPGIVEEMFERFTATDAYVLELFLHG